MCTAYELFFKKVWYLLNFLCWAKVTLENLLIKLLITKPKVCVGLGLFYFFQLTFPPLFLYFSDQRLLFVVNAEEFMAPVL